jgi:hypothetical protein
LEIKVLEEIACKSAAQAEHFFAQGALVLWQSIQISIVGLFWLLNGRKDRMNIQKCEKFAASYVIFLLYIHHHCFCSNFIEVKMAFSFKSVVAYSAVALLASNISFAAQEVTHSSGQSKSQQRQNLAKKPLLAEKTVETKTIYRQVMKDGSVVFSDVGTQGAAKTVAIPYQSTSSSNALQLASQQKEHWRRQSEGFNQRQAQRDRDLDQTRRDRAYHQHYAYAKEFGWYGPAPRIVYGAGGPPVRGNFPQQGVSGVGAAHNVPSSFIGSGFATSSPLAPNFGAGRR